MICPSASTRDPSRSARKNTPDIWSNPHVSYFAKLQSRFSRASFSLYSLVQLAKNASCFGVSAAEAVCFVFFFARFVGMVLGSGFLIVPLDSRKNDFRLLHRFLQRAE